MSNAYIDFSHDHMFLGKSHEENAKRTLWVVALTVVMMVAEITAGYLTGSMALLADGFHMATHAGALGIPQLLTVTQKDMPQVRATVLELARWETWVASPLL
jgi:Co/Zn/Cd efflux system component